MFVFIMKLTLVLMGLIAVSILFDPIHIQVPHLYLDS